MASPNASAWRDVGPIQLRRCGDLTPFREAIQSAGYTEQALAAVILRDSAGRPLDAVSLERRLGAPSPLNTLLKLFVRCLAVPIDDFRRALPGLDASPLVDCGILTVEGDCFRASVSLIPEEGFLVAREHWPEFVGGSVARDHVSGGGASTRIVARFAARRQGERALDLGTGTGIQALVTARHAGEVVATDVNLRALNFAECNARLNGLDNVRCRHGSLFAPVADEQFDLIVTNPPFVISPELHCLYRDGGRAGDELSEQVIRDAPPRLAEGGFATVLFNWHHRQADDWSERPRQWIAGNGCDAWLLGLETTDPVSYASTWLLPECGNDREQYARRLDEWLAYFERLEIGRITLGIAVMRRRSGTNWFRADQAPAPEPPRDSSSQIQRIFAAEDFLAVHARDETLLTQRLQLTPQHELQQILHAEDGHWHVQSAQLVQTDGFPWPGNVDRLMSTVLAGCDGRRPLSSLVEDLARQFSRPAAEITPACLAVLRALLRWGYLVPG